MILWLARSLRNSSDDIPLSTSILRLVHFNRSISYLCIFSGVRYDKIADSFQTYFVLKRSPFARNLKRMGETSSLPENIFSCILTFPWSLHETETIPLVFGPKPR